VQQYIAYGLIIAGALWLAVPFVKGLFVSKPVEGRTVIPTNGTAYLRSSDQKAPTGFKEHVAIIKEASPSASADVRWQYAEEGLTEALVLRREVERLGKAST
jgi:hypothetical protein